MVGPMGHSLRSEREQIIASLTALFTSHSLRPERRDVCVRCGKAIQYLDVTFSLYETDSAWSVRLPFCTCDDNQHRLCSTSREKCSMSTGVAASPSKSWKELYRAALYEPDKNRVSERIAKAEWALALRARELFHTGTEYLQERQAVDAALHALHALRRTATSAAGRTEEFA